MKTTALLSLLPILAALPSLSTAHPHSHHHGHGDNGSRVPSQRKTLNFGPSHPQFRYETSSSSPSSSNAYVKRSHATTVYEPKRDARDVARGLLDHEIGKSASKNGGEGLKEGPSREGVDYFIRDDVSA